MELRQLEFFHATSQLNSISKAAEKLHVAQPAVSVSIQKLEEELGVQLFERSQRQIALTEEGKLFSRRVNEILMKIGDTLHEVKDLRLNNAGSIRIGIPPMVGLFLFPQIFAKFRRQYPDITLNAVEAGSLTIQNLLEEGSIDIGIITESNPRFSFEIHPITAVQVRVYLPHSHPLNSFSSIPFAKLRDEPLILFKEDTYSRRVIVNECHKHQIDPRIIFSSSHIDTIISLVELEVGISFLFDAIAQKYSTVSSLPLEEPISSPVVLAWNRKRYLTAASRVFIDFITGIRLNL